MQGNTWLKRNSHTEKKKSFKAYEAGKKFLHCFMPGKKFYHQRFGKKLDHVSFGGLLINVLANILVDYRSIYWPLCRPILGRLSTDMMATLGCYSLSVNSRPIFCQRIPWLTCRSKSRSTCQSMNWSSGSLVSANCWSRGCVLADMGLVLGHYSLLVGHGTAASQLVVCRWIACDQPIIIFIENTGLPVI